MQQRAGNVDPAPLAAGKLAHRALAQILEIQQRRKLGKPGFERAAGDPVQRRPAFQIVLHRQRLIQHGVLEYHAQAALDGIGVGIQIDPADPDGSGILGKLSAQDVDRGAFARAVHAQKGEQLALFDMEAQVLHRFDSAEAFG